MGWHAALNAAGSTVQTTHQQPGRGSIGAAPFQEQGMHHQMRAL